MRRNNLDNRWNRQQKDIKDAVDKVSSGGYLDQLQKDFEKAGQTQTERTVFNQNRQEAPKKQWWE